MNKNVERAKEMLPAIILTILSIIQALALELFWNRLVESEYLWQAESAAVIGWLQALAMLLGIVLIWLVHVSFVLRFRWLPSLEDMVVPFLIGLLEFGMVDLMHPDLLGGWMILLSAVFAVSVAASHRMMQRARGEPENAYFFDHVGPPSLLDYRQSIATVLALMMFGILLLFFPDAVSLAFTALTFALAALCYQMLQAKRYWMHSVVPDRDVTGTSETGSADQ